MSHERRHRPVHVEPADHQHGSPDPRRRLRVDASSARDSWGNATRHPDRVVHRGRHAARSRKASTGLHRRAGAAGACRPRRSPSPPRTASPASARSCWRVDGGAVHTYTEPFLGRRNGTPVVEYRATDRAGNREAWHTLTLKIDTKRAGDLHPAGREGRRHRRHLARTGLRDAQDLGRHVRRPSRSISVDGAPAVALGTKPVVVKGDGPHTVTVAARDAAGNLRLRDVRLRHRHHGAGGGAAAGRGHGGQRADRDAQRRRDQGDGRDPLLRQRGREGHRRHQRRRRRRGPDPGRHGRRPATARRRWDGRTADRNSRSRMAATRSPSRRSTRPATPASRSRRRWTSTPRWRASPGHRRSSSRRTATGSPRSPSCRSG